jgi:hypothetical protein
MCWLDIGWVIGQERTQGILREEWDKGVAQEAEMHTIYMY